jgi:hypothetical protein
MDIDIHTLKNDLYDVAALIRSGDIILALERLEAIDAEL